MKIIMFMLIILFLFIVSTLFIQENSSNEISSNSSFECGFESIYSSRIPFSIHFFSIIIVFLIFDLEIIIIIPIIRSYYNFTFASLLFSVMMLILILGLLLEWNEGTLEWDV